MNARLTHQMWQTREPWQWGAAGTSSVAPYLNTEGIKEGKWICEACSAQGEKLFRRKRIYVRSAVCGACDGMWNSFHCVLNSQVQVSKKNDKFHLLPNDGRVVPRARIFNVMFDIFPPPPFPSPHSIPSQMVTFVIWRLSNQHGLHNHKQSLGGPARRQLTGEEGKVR